MDASKTLCVDGYRVEYQVVARDGDYRVRVTTRKRGPGRQDHVVYAPSPLVFESKEEAERHARYLMLAVKHVHPTGKPEYTVI
jgi:hypothetical protein